MRSEQRNYAIKFNLLEEKAKEIRQPKWWQNLGIFSVYSYFIVHYECL